MEHYRSQTETMSLFVSVFVDKIISETFFEYIEK